MRRELLNLAHQLSLEGESFVLATVIARKAPFSAQVGDMALIRENGEFHGWVGGSCTKPTVLAEAKRALLRGTPRRVVITPEAAVTPDLAGARSDVQVYPMTCHSGGSVEIHIQPVLSAPTLVVYGASPTAQALAKLGVAMGYQVCAVDPQIAHTDLPDAVQRAENVDALDVPHGTQPKFCVVATQGEWDEEALLAALAENPAYVSVVASKRRFEEMRAALRTEANRAHFDAIKNPAGLDLGAQLPEEIALSILAELVQQHARKRRSATLEGDTTAEATQVGTPESAPLGPGVRVPPAFAQQFATDPVCGMKVSIHAQAKRAEWHGQPYFFCCGGCQSKFLANPEHYVSARA